MVDIDEMKAGRELDALVAEKVMGCTVRYIESTPFCGCGQTCDYPHGEPDREGQLYGDLQHYSTDIAAAWEVFCDHDCVEKVIRQINNGKWMCSFSGGGVYSHADTAPLAICRAVLKAVL